MSKGTSAQRLKARKAKLLEVGQVGQVDVSRVCPFKGQPRKHFNQEEMDLLILSISNVGQEVPIQVTLLPDDKKFDYQIVSGERRWRAVTRIKEEQNPNIKITVFVLPPVDKRRVFEKSVIENCCREDLCFLEEIKAVSKMAALFPRESQAELGVKFGKSQKWVSDRLAIASKLHPDVEKFLDPRLPKSQQLKSTVTTFLAENVARDEQFKYAKLVVEKNMSTFEAVEFIWEKANKEGHILKKKK